MKQVYEAPKIADERYLEAEAMYCIKTPGIGASNADFCGQVWAEPHGNKDGCYMNTDARSS